MLHCVGVCFYIFHSLSFASLVNDRTRDSEPGIEVEVCYDVIPYVTTSVFPESQTSIIQISGILTAPQSLSYRKSARPEREMSNFFYIPTTGVHFITTQVKILIRKLLGNFCEKFLQEAPNIK